MLSTLSDKTAELTVPFVLRDATCFIQQAPHGRSPESVVHRNSIHGGESYEHGRAARAGGRPGNHGQRYDEMTTVIPVQAIIRRIQQGGGQGLVLMAGVQSTISC
jgi:hypothetical protein